MKLRRLAIHQLPGIPRPGFRLNGFGDGINVIVGPNASGKSSIPRAVRAALYAREVAREHIDVEAVFALAEREREEHGDGEREGTVQAARTGASLAWTRDGQRIEAPLLPEHRFVSCYTLHIEDLLAGDADTDADIALRIAREMAGGYDLDASRHECGFFVPPRAGQTEAKGLSDSESDLRRRQGLQRELRSDEERLDALERERLDALEAGRDAELVEKALRLLEKRRERLDLERRKAAFPPDLDRLRGNEANTLDRLRGDRERAEEGLAQAEAERRAAERSLAATGLAGSRLGEGAIADQRARLARLQELEGEIAHERRQADEAGAARDRAARELGGEPGEGVRLGPDAIHAVDQALEASRLVAAELRELEAELRRLSEVPERGPDPERLDEARRELLHWLSAPVAPGSPTGRSVAFAVLAVTAAAGAVAAGYLVHPAALALLIPAALALVYLLLDRGGAGAGQRREAEQRYRRLGFERPEKWERERIAELLMVADRDLAAARQRVDDLRRWRDAERKREDLRTAFERDRARLADIARRVNFDPDALDASFDRWLRLTGDYDRADLALCESRARRATRERDADAERAGIVSFLSEHGEDTGAGVPGVDAPGSETPAADVPGPVPAGLGSPAAEALRHRLERLAERVRRRDGAERELRTAGEKRVRLAGEIENRQAEIDALYRDAGLGPGDEAELRRRLEFLERWRTLVRGLDEVRVIEGHLHGELGDRPDLLSTVEEDGEPALVSRRDRLRERSARESGLLEEIGGIRARVEHASKGRDLEESRARRQRAEDALHRRFDESMLAEAGAFLLDQVESEHVRTSRPAVLHRAEDWFARFTRHQFELAMGSGGEGAFRARETATGEWRALSELSSGTRMQLLLAVRLAFAIEAEKGRTPLPLFLDEALTTADPERFRAAADSLRRFSEEEGRQIFYLTAQPEERGYWAEASPTVIDLDASRRAGRAVIYPEEIGLPPAAMEPARPDGSRPEEYAVRIGVEPLRPWEHPSSTHLFHLLRDDLDLLWRLLRTGIERLGPLVSLLDSGEAKRFLSASESSRLRLRVAGAEAWVEAWREGRGRPVDRDVLAASGAVSPVFIDQMAALAEEVDGDGGRLLQAMDEGKTPHFRIRFRRQLEEWFQENGYLPDAAPLDPRGLARRVAVAFSAHGSPPESSFDEAAELSRSMAASLARRYREPRAGTAGGGPHVQREANRSDAI